MSACVCKRKRGRECFYISVYAMCLIVCIIVCVSYCLLAIGTLLCQSDPGSCFQPTAGFNFYGSFFKISIFIP